MLVARSRMSGPIIATTPQKPNVKPATRAASSFSSAVARWATSTANSGVVALRIAASPLGISVCPPQDQAERERVIQKSEDGEWPPGRIRVGQRSAGDTYQHN